MKRKPLKYMEQRRLVHFHTHQKRFGEMIGKRHFVSLPDPVHVTDSTAAGGDTAASLETPMATASKLPGAQMAPQTSDATQRPGGAVGANTVPPNAPSKPQQAVTPMQPMNMGPRQLMIRPQQPQQQMWPRGPMHPNQQQNRMQMILKKIQKDQIELEQQRRVVGPGPYGGHPIPRPSPYPMVGQMQQRPAAAQMGGYPAMTALQQQRKAQQIQMMRMMTNEQRQVYLHRMRMIQQQQQAAAMNQGMMGAPQYGPQYPQQVGHPQMPMQGVQQMQVQQQMQHGYNQQMMVRQQFAPPQQPGAPPPMNPMQRPMY